MKINGEFKYFFDLIRVKPKPLPLPLYFLIFTKVIFYQNEQCLNIPLMFLL